MEKKIYGNEDYLAGRIPFKVNPATYDTHENLSVVCDPYDTVNEEFLMDLGRTLIAIFEASREARRRKVKEPSSRTSDHRLKLIINGTDTYTLEDGPAFKDAVYEIFDATTIEVDYYFSWLDDFYHLMRNYYYNLVPVTLSITAEKYKDRINFLYREIFGSPCGEMGFFCRKIENGKVYNAQDCMSPEIINYESEYGWSDLFPLIVAYHTAEKYPELLKKLRDITCEFFPQDAIDTFRRCAWDVFPSEIPPEEYDSLLPHTLITYGQTYFKDLKDYKEYVDAIYEEMKPYMCGKDGAESDNDVELIICGRWAQFDTFTIAEWEITENGPRVVGVHF